MLLNYIKIAIRNIAKYKVFSFINIAGMAISLASFILIALFISDELQYDRHHPDGDRTYRVYNVTDIGGTVSYLPIVPYPFASYMKKDFPEIESTLQIMDTYGEKLFIKEDKEVLEPSGVFAESAIFDMLSLNVIAGKAADALNKPNTIALSQSLAIKYFGAQNPVGETIKVNHNDWQVTAVYADPPRHFHLKLNYVLSFATTGWATSRENNWQQQQIFTYLKLKPGTDANALEAKFKPFVEKYAYPLIVPKGISYVPHLQNIKDIHLHSSNFQWEIAQRGSAESVYILAGTAVLILIIASLNFINLSTARSMKRMKEVGVRKVVGADRMKLIMQFISESVVFAVAGFLLAIILAEIALPFINLAIEKQLRLPYSPLYLMTEIVFCVLLGVLAGSYPAFHLSRFRPGVVLSGRNEKIKGRSVLRESLVVVQFMLSFFLISASWIILSQNDLLQNKNLGFSKEHVVVVPLTTDQLRNQEVTKRNYGNHPNVISSTIGFGLPGDIVAGDEVINPVDGKVLPANLFLVDFDYIKTMGMELKAGRDFSADFKTDTSKSFIINETAVKTYGFGTAQEAIGKNLDWKQWHNGSLKKGTVIGVVKDFNFKSLREKVTPAVLQIYPQASWKLAVRIKPDHIDETLDHLRKTYEKSESRWIFTYSFLDQNFDEMYKSEKRLGLLFTIFTYLAMAVACLGLFGLVEYSVNQRAKEISIRKVFGASISALLVLLTRRYFMLLIIAFLLIIPVSYYVANEWLNNFEYRIDVGPMLFLKASVVVVLITCMTISFQSIRASLANPAEVLKNE